jgi:MFS family permease
MVVLNASLSSFSSGYCCASIAGAILFLQQDTLFFPLPSPDPNPSNYSPSPSSSSSSNSSNHTNYTAPTPGWYGYPTNANIHSCMSSQGANTATPSSSSSDLVLDALMSDFQRGWLVSCILLSALIGALFASSVADTIGRRPTQIFTNLFFIVGCAGMYFAPNNIDHNDDHGYWILVGARALTGLGVGISSVLVNLYITEISPAKSRGELGGWAPFAVTAGILVSYILASFIGETIAADQGKLEWLEWLLEWLLQWLLQWLLEWLEWLLQWLLQWLLVVVAVVVAVVVEVVVAMVVAVVVIVVIAVVVRLFSLFQCNKSNLNQH